MDKTGIEWTDATWNPVTGCSNVSPGCDHCYAEGIARRFDGTKAYPNGFDVTLRPERLDQPLRWQRSRRIFVNSMSDLFHADIPHDYIAGVFAVMAIAQRHTFQVLTKRPGRMRSLLHDADFRSAVYRAVNDRPIWERPDDGHVDSWPLPNVWLGVSTENQKWADVRIPVLLDTPAAVRFISAEPLLGPIGLLGDPESPGPAIIRTGYESRTDYGTGTEWATEDEVGIDWVIVGGESGPGARPMNADWARSLRDECNQADIAFLFKQWGSHDSTGRRMSKKAAGRELDGRLHDEYPT
jgi:protein gp37